MKIFIYVFIMIVSIGDCLALDVASFNPSYAEKVMEKYKGNTLSPDDVEQINLRDGTDYSYKMIDLEENQIYLYRFTGIKDGLFNFKIDTTPLLLSETISLDSRARFVKSSLFSYDKNCSFVLGSCERIRQSIRGDRHKEKVDTSFDDGVWVIKVYREIDNQLKPHAVNHAVYDKQGLPIYMRSEIFFGKTKIISELARVI